MQSTSHLQIVTSLLNKNTSRGASQPEQDSALKKAKELIKKYDFKRSQFYGIDDLILDIAFSNIIVINGYKFKVINHPSLGDILLEDYENLYERLLKYNKFVIMDSYARYPLRYFSGNLYDIPNNILTGSRSLLTVFFFDEKIKGENLIGGCNIIEIKNNTYHIDYENITISDYKHVLYIASRRDML